MLCFAWRSGYILMSLGKQWWSMSSVVMHKVSHNRQNSCFVWGEMCVCVCVCVSGYRFVWIYVCVKVSRCFVVIVSKPIFSTWDISLYPDLHTSCNILCIMREGLCIWYLNAWILLIMFLYIKHVLLTDIIISKISFLLHL